jgi:hypothetical protein
MFDLFAGAQSLIFIWTMSEMDLMILSLKKQPSKDIQSFLWTGHMEKE